MEALPQFNEEQIRAVVTEARRWRKDVAAHAYGGEGARAAVLGGARSIEHGMLLDESILNLMVKHGTYWCPTLSNFTPTQALVGYPESFIQAIMARHTEAFEMALRLGVRIAFGTDAGRVRHGTNAGEFALMVERGMDRMRAIQAATSVAAELLRMEDEIGAVKDGASGRSGGRCRRSSRGCELATGRAVCHEGRPGFQESGGARLTRKSE